MDQKFLAGIGNIYSDEILWGAGLRWDRMSDSLSSQEVRRLYRSMVETLQDAVKYRGSSLADKQYVDLFGQVRASTSTTTRCTRTKARPADGAGSRSCASAWAVGPPSTAPACQV